MTCHLAGLARGGAGGAGCVNQGGGENTRRQGETTAVRFDRAAQGPEHAVDLRAIEEAAGMLIAHHLSFLRQLTVSPKPVGAHRRWRLPQTCGRSRTTCRRTNSPPRSVREGRQVWRLAAAPVVSQRAKHPTHSFRFRYSHSILKT